MTPTSAYTDPVWLMCCESLTKQYATSATPITANTNDSVTARPMISAAPVPSRPIAPTGPIRPTENAAASTRLSSVCSLSPEGGGAFSIGPRYTPRTVVSKRHMHKFVQSRRPIPSLAMDPIVSTQWLSGAGADIALLDVRWYPDGRDARTEFSAGHLPGAVLVALDAVCSAPASDARGRHPLPSPAAFAASLSELGVGDGDVVVAYDDAGGVLAARLVWMLRALGHEAALLDAGTGPFPETGPGPPLPRVKPPLTVPDEWPSRLLASIDEVAAVADEAGSGADRCAAAGPLRGRARRA